MKTGRAIFAGSLIWFLVLVLFGVMDFIPTTHESTLLQGVIAGIGIIPFALIGAQHYYKRGDQSSGLMVGLVMISTALLLDLLITVPLVERPLHGTTHFQFFTNPLLWILVLEDLIVIWLYYRLKIARS